MAPSLFFFRLLKRRLGARQDVDDEVATTPDNKEQMSGHLRRVYVIDFSRTIIHKSDLDGGEEGQRISAAYETQMPQPFIYRTIRLITNYLSKV